jgi:aquaporin Z
MLHPLSLFVELVGTFVFINVIFQFAGKDWGAFAIGLALAVVILFGGAVSGGHYNPAVSLAMFIAQKIDAVTLGGYIAMQLLGGYLAWVMYSKRFAPV